MKFYVTGTNKDNQEFVVHSEAHVRIAALKDIAAQAKERGLTVDLNNVRMVTGTQKQESCITKAFKERKRLRGLGKRTDFAY